MKWKAFDKGRSLRGEEKKLHEMTGQTFCLFHSKQCAVLRTENVFLIKY